MYGQATINGTDIGDFGAALVKGAYEALLTPPPTKAYVQNDSRLQHGKRVIVENADDVKFDSREVSFTVFFEGNTRGAYLSGLSGFVTAITRGLIEFHCTTLGITFKLLYLSCSKGKDYGLNAGTYTFRFLEPNPNDR